MSTQHTAKPKATGGAFKPGDPRINRKGRGRKTHELADLLRRLSIIALSPHYWRKLKNPPPTLLEVFNAITAAAFAVQHYERHHGTPAITEEEKP